IDTSMGIGVVAAHDCSNIEYEWGHSPISNRIPPLIAVPTTAGTGSEVTLWAVITDPKRKIKFNVGGTPNIASWVAVIDPELTIKLPAAVTAGTGMDALAHAVECYTMSYHQPFTDAVALMAMEYVTRYLRVAFSQAANVDVRGTTVWRAAEMAVDYVHQLTVDVEIPSLEELGFSRDEIPMLAEKAAADPQSIGNPRDVDASAYKRIYARAFDLGRTVPQHVNGDKR